MTDCSGNIPPNSGPASTEDGHGQHQGSRPLEHGDQPSLELVSLSNGWQPNISQQPLPGRETCETSVAEAGWMEIPTVLPTNYHPGLEHLSAIDQLLLHPIDERLEGLPGVKTDSGFTVKNCLGERLFYAVEHSECCTGYCCGPADLIQMKVLNRHKKEVIHLTRPLACDSCCFSDLFQSMEVYAPLGCLVGTVQQEWGVLTPSFSVKNSSGDTVLLIEGPTRGDVDFKVLKPDRETAVGKLSNQWRGLPQESFIDAETFGITFPMDLDVRVKAILLGACILINAMYFEQTAKNVSRHPVIFENQPVPVE